MGCIFSWQRFMASLNSISAASLAICLCMANRRSTTSMDTSLLITALDRISITVGCCCTARLSFGMGLLQFRVLFRGQNGFAAVYCWLCWLDNLAHLVAVD